MIPTNPNLESLIKVAQKLGELRKQVVVVGGCATGLLITDPLAPEVRATQDVDFIVEITTKKEYYEFSELLRQKGFCEDISAKILCRWRIDDCIVDVIPTEGKVLGFNNRWYSAAMNNSIRLDLTPQVTIRLIAAPYFIATKLEAFHDRGKNDFLISADLEDIISVIDGRDELLSEIKNSPRNLQEYIVQEINSLLNTSGFIQNLGGYVPGDPASQARIPKILERLKKFSKP